MISELLAPVLGLSGAAAYALVAGLAFGEASFLLGFVLPGETAVILGGVIASQGHVSLPLMVVVAVGSAILGDSVGYEVGRHFGDRLLDLRPLRSHQRALDQARRFLQRRGGTAVFIGRFTAFLRAVVPGLAGMSGMPYPKFLGANAAGGMVWATGYTLLGYFLGHAYRQVESASSKASTALLAVVVVGLIGLWIRNRRRERRLESEPPPGAPEAPEVNNEAELGAPAGAGAGVTNGVDGRSAGPVPSCGGSP